MKLRGKMTTTNNAVRTIPPQLLEISSTVAQLDGDVRLYVEMLVSESDIEARYFAIWMSHHLLNDIWIISSHQIPGVRLLKIWSNQYLKIRWKATKLKCWFSVSTPFSYTTSTPHLYWPDPSAKSELNSHQCLLYQTLVVQGCIHSVLSFVEQIER